MFQLQRRRILVFLLEKTRPIPFLRRFFNRLATNTYSCKTTPRPRAFSLFGHIPKPVEFDDQHHLILEPQSESAPCNDYTSWPMLTDKRFSARHLPPADPLFISELPEDTPFRGGDNMGDITRLFLREGEMKKSRSSLLFMFFAQWFTDSVLRVDPLDRRKNTSNHNIDLCQIYGLTEESAHILRDKAGQQGKLRCQQREDGEYPDYLIDQDAEGEPTAENHWHIKAEYRGLPYTQPEVFAKIVEGWDAERIKKLYAVGLDRGNSSIGYVAISTIFLREHNRICDTLAKHYPSWDDERLFQTARMINTVILIKLTIEDYINHIVGLDLFIFDPKFAEKQRWYRIPWIALEFDMLYRWHGMVPDSISYGDIQLGDRAFRMNNGLLEDKGINAIIELASSEHAGEISLKNVPQFMMGAEYANIQMGRRFRLRSYNDYRVQFGEPRLKSFDELTDDKDLAKALEEKYRHIDKLEFIVGVFAERSKVKRQLFGDLLNTMVAYDAFTQIYTNPLLASNVFKAKHFTPYGMDLIKSTKSVQDLVNRNTCDGDPLAKFGLAL